MSTRPLDATRELATAAGLLTYSEVAEHLAVNIVLCLDALLENPRRHPHYPGMDLRHPLLYRR